MSSIRDFIPLSKLGEGTFSTVYKVQRISDHQIYALKKARMKNLSQKQKQNALNQIRILASLQCYSIIAYKEAFFDQKLNLLCVVMEYANQGDLQKLVLQYKKGKKNISEKIIWRMIADVLVGLNELHEKGIVHRDLKSANIFISSQSQKEEISNNSKEIYKLGDLNVSKVNHGDFVYTQTGTPYYASPQVWRDQPYDSKSDIWSFGCIIYEMASLFPPFQGKDMQQLFRNVQNKSHKPIPEQYSYELSDFVDLCLNKKARNRPTASQLLNHSIVSKFVNFRKRNKQLQSELGDKNYFGIDFTNNPKEKARPKTSVTDRKQLLETIKLPTDLRFLKDKLPNSKYNSENKLKNVFGHLPTEKQLNKISKNRSDIHQPQQQRQKKESERPVNEPLKKLLSPYQNISYKVNLSGSKANKNSSSRQESTGKKVQKPIESSAKYYSHHIDVNSSLVANQNQSGAYLSPKNFKKPQNYEDYSYQSPQNHKNVQKNYENKLKILYSDRKTKPNSYSIDVESYKNNSQKKPASKISDRYTKFIQEEVTKKQFSIPKTEKQKMGNQSNYIHYLPQKYRASSKCEQHGRVQKLGVDYRAIEEWKKKLAKKGRVFSSNNMKNYYPYNY